jgi:hypothetical protein
MTAKASSVSRSSTRPRSGSENELLTTAVANLFIVRTSAPRDCRHVRSEDLAEVSAIHGRASVLGRRTFERHVSIGRES